MNLLGTMPHLIRDELAPRALLVAHVTDSHGHELAHYFDHVIAGCPGLAARLNDHRNRVPIIPNGFDTRLTPWRSEVRHQTNRAVFVGTLGETDSGPYRTRSAVLRDLWHAGLVELFSDDQPSWLSGKQSRVDAARKRPSVHGRSMARVLASSALTIHVPSDSYLGQDACSSALRLYEATGLGSALATLSLKDLSLQFAIADSPEIQVFEPENAIGVVSEMLQNPATTRAVAQRGHQRTMRDHTVSQRVAELVPLLDQWLS